MLPEGNLGGGHGAMPPCKFFFKSAADYFEIYAANHVLSAQHFTIDTDLC